MYLNNQELYNLISPDFEKNLSLLKDKPEETIDSSLKALGFATIGLSKSVAMAAKHPLPELSDKQKETLFDLIKQRLDGTPLAYITARQNFMDIELFCDGRDLFLEKKLKF